MRKQITIKYIRDYILDNHITEYDTIVMNMLDFDDIILEHRDTYGTSINNPFYLLKVLIVPDEGRRIDRNQLKVIRNDSRQIKHEDEGDEITEQTVYRCGWCGNIVDYDGSKLSSETRDYHIAVLQKYGDGISRQVHGYCCKHKN